MIYVTIFYLVLVATTNLTLHLVGLLLAFGFDWWIYQKMQIEIRKATERKRPERKYWGEND